MGLDDKAKAAAKNVEGKIQDAAGNVTGDPQAQAEGKAKQGEAQASNAKEDLKDGVKRTLDNV
ncbi:MAG TPA: CsbD family protein [Thermosynechococcaceae cyanobacterium]|jgi:uncharacterized protein YjbJ (UPF0337 family)